MGLDADSRVRLKRLSRDRLALERSFPGEQPPPGLRPVETQMLRLQQAVGNQAVTGFVHSPTSTPEERFAALIHILYSSAWVVATSGLCGRPAGPDGQAHSGLCRTAALPGQ